MNIRKIILEEIEDFDWITKDSVPTRSDHYSYWLEKVLKVLPNEFSDVREFSGGKILKILFNLKVSMKNLEDELTDMYINMHNDNYRWLSASADTLVKDVEYIIDAIRYRDQGIEWCETNRPYCGDKTNRLMYQSSLKDLKSRIPTMIKMLQEIYD